MVNVLISLVGSNPIPVYCLNKYLLGEYRTNEELERIPKPNKLLFVFSDDTKKYYEGIKKRLGDEYKDIIEVCNLKCSQTYADLIEEQIQTKLDEINEKDKIETIILNNTGGTKPMAIYSTMAVYKFAQKNRNIQEIECYVDPIQNKVRLNSLLNPEKYNSSNSYLPEDKDLRFYLKDISMEDILAIHGLPLNCYDEGKLLPNSYEDIKIVSKEELKNFSYKIINEYWGEHLYWEKYTEFFSTLKKLEYIKKDYEFYKKAIEEYCHGKLDEKINPVSSQNFKKIFNGYLEKKEESSWLEDALPSIKDIINTITNNKKAEKIYKFLSGTWLEHYLMIAVEEAIEEEGLKDEIKLYHSFVCYLDENYKKSHFEIDLVALKGYQITVFTCTTDGTKSLTKSKSFEGLHRVEQLGGEHAKLCIVNMKEDKEELDRELVGFNSNFYKSKEIISREDLKDYDYLVKKLRDILKK